MAVTKIWAIKDSLQRVLDYAANPNKTEYDALAAKIKSSTRRVLPQRVKESYLGPIECVGATIGRPST